MKIKKSTLYVGIIVFLILAFSFVLTFLFNDINSLKIEDEKAKTIYWIIKVVVSLCLIGSYVMSTIADKTGFNIAIAVATVLMFVPFVVRLCLQIEGSTGTIFSIIIAFISVIIFLIILFGMDVLNDKAKEERESIEK